MYGFPCTGAGFRLWFIMYGIPRMVLHVLLHAFTSIPGMVFCVWFSTELVCIHVFFLVFHVTVIYVPGTVFHCIGMYMVPRCTGMCKMDDEQIRRLFT